jgi:hypothetical protein
MSNRYTRGQIFIFDDEVEVGPISYVYDPINEVEINLWEELLKVGMSMIKRATKSKIVLPRSTWDAIVSWCDTGFGGMQLHNYLNRMLAGSCLPPSPIDKSR